MCLGFAFTVFLPLNFIKNACEERDDDRNLCHDNRCYLNICAKTVSLCSMSMGLFDALTGMCPGTEDMDISWRDLEMHYIKLTATAAAKRLA